MSKIIHMTVLFLTGLALALHFANYGVLIPAIRSDLHISAGQVGLLSTSLFLGVGLAYPLGGWLSDQYGARRVIICALLCTGFGGSFAASVPHFQWILLCRFVVGCGIGTALVAGSQAAAQLGQHAALGMGIFGGATQAGAALGLLVTPFLLDVEGWRTALDIAGFPSIIVSVFWFLLKEEASKRRTQGFPRIVGALRTPSIWLLGVMLLGTLGLGQAIAPWLPLLFSSASGIPLGVAATLGTLILLVGAFVRPLGGLLLSYHLFRPLPLMRMGSAISCCGMVIIVLNRHLPMLLLGSTLLVIGTTLPFAAVFSEADTAGRQAGVGAGTAQGIISMIAAPGAACGPAIIGFIQQSSTFSNALLPGALMASVACLTTFILKNPKRSRVFFGNAPFWDTSLLHDGLFPKREGAGTVFDHLIVHLIAQKKRYERI